MVFLSRSIFWAKLFWSKPGYFELRVKCEQVNPSYTADQDSLQLLRSPSIRTIHLRGFAGKETFSFQHVRDGNETNITVARKQQKGPFKWISVYTVNWQFDYVHRLGLSRRFELYETS